MTAAKNTTRILLLLLCASAHGAEPGSCGAALPLPAGVSQESLLRKMRIRTPDLPEGLTLRRSVDSPAGTDDVIMAATLTNAGNTPQTLARVPLLDAVLELSAPAMGPFHRMARFESSDKWYDSHYWTAGGWARVGKDWHHPGPSLPTVRAFRCPRAGEISVTGRVFKRHVHKNNGVKVAIRHNLKLLWSAEIKGDDGKGVEPSLKLTVKQDDFIRFVVDPNGDIYCDTTGWDPIVRYADGETFRASAAFGNVQGRGNWHYEVQKGDPGAVHFKPLAYKKSRWFDSTFWQGGHVWCRVGKNWHHPGEELPSVRRFACPNAGKITITGRVFAMHKGGDGTVALIRHNEQYVWRQAIGGSDDKGVETHLTLDVTRGDSIRFIIDAGRAISCDTTGWDPAITYERGPAFQASEGFAAKQGVGNWHYEMYQDKEPIPALPALARLSGSLLLRHGKLQLGMVQETSDADLPFLILSDGEDGNGFALAADAASAGFRIEVAKGGRALSLRLHVAGPLTVGPGKTVALPAVTLRPYIGAWLAGLAALRDWAGLSGAAPRLKTFGKGLSAAYRGLSDRLGEVPDPDLLLLAQTEWARDDRIDGTAPAFRNAVVDHLSRTEQLLADLRQDQGEDFLALEGVRLTRLAAQARRADVSVADWSDLYLRTRLLKRGIALKNPLLDFDKLLLCKRVPPSYSHLVMQYYGFRARPGGGLFVLENPGRSLAVRSILRDQLPPGSVLDPCLSHDAKRIVFSYVKCPDKPYRAQDLAVNEEGKDEGYYHIYEINVDGSGLRQLTAGPYEDLMPECLPDGGIVFCSTRRKGYSRCFGGAFSHRWDSYTVHRMDRDGANIRALSFNDVSEWFPSVSNVGDILYARWDYIDRDAVTHQNLWAMRPDGSNPVAVWGNASPKPHCMFQARAIPGSRKIVFIASAHHAITAGPVCLLDPALDANSLDAVTRITPLPFPEVEGRQIEEYYGSPWPLSEKCFLVAYSPIRLRFEGESRNGPNPANALGIYLLDAAGNRELIYRDPAIGSTSPIPLRPTPAPPVLASALPAHADAAGEMVITDVYEGLGNVPRGSIKAIRIVQIFPKITPWANNPRIGLAGEENARAILGTVPVEPDGSAHFVVPARKAILFQVLDKDGFAYQTMRSLTYVQPGERTSCIGCHEHRMMAPPSGTAMALRRPASKIDPGELGGRPFSFVETVQPVLDKHCTKCHSGDKPKKSIDLTGAPHKGFTKSYWSLCGDPKGFHGRNTNPENAAKALVPRFGQRNQIQITPPGGMYGALGSRLVKMLRKGHSNVKLSANDVRRIAAWIDSNAIFYGAYDPKRQAMQLAGKRIDMPKIQ